MQRLVDVDHRDLDDVGGAALDRGVERGPLGGLADVAVAAVQLGQVAPPAEHRRRVAVLAGLVDDLVQVVTHPAEPGEVLLHLHLGFLGGDLQLRRQPVGAQPVRQPVGHRLDPAPQLGCDLVDRHAERPGGDERVQILAGAERLDQALVAGQVRHDPHLDLAVVGGHQLGVALADDERVADPPAGLGADRDVLQVRLGRRQPAGGGDGLVERGVNPAVGGHRLQQPVDGDLEPGGVAVGQHVLQERVPGLVEQRLQRVGVGGVAGLGALGLRHLQLVEQHHLQLFGRAEVDLLADHPVRRLGGVADLGGELALQLGQLVQVDGDAGGLHAGEHALHRQLHLAQQRRRVDPRQLLVERIGQIHHRAGAQDHRLHGLIVDAVGVVQQRKLLLLRVSARSSRFR